MKKIVVLLGASGSGKSTIEKEIESKGFKRIISHTTRPIRDGEIDGINYHFVDINEFELSSMEGRFITETLYNDWKYGIKKSEIPLNSESVVVLEPIGFEELVDFVGEKNIISFLIEVDDKKRLLRSLKREDKPNCKEICRRFISDIDLFSTARERVNYIVKNNDNVDEAVDFILNIINSNL